MDYIPPVGPPSYVGASEFPGSSKPDPTCWKRLENFLKDWGNSENQTAANAKAMADIIRSASFQKDMASAAIGGREGDVTRWLSEFPKTLDAFIQHKCSAFDVVKRLTDVFFLIH